MEFWERGGAYLITNLTSSLICELSPNRESDQNPKVEVV